MPRRRRLKRSSYNTLLILAISIISLALTFISGHFSPGSKDPILGQGLDSVKIRREGLVLYNRHCMSCHGVNGRGTSFGPALTDPLYGPEKLSDKAFIEAVLYGVPQKNWDYGPMAPLKDIKQVDIAMIMAYMRALQMDLEAPQND